MIKLLIGIMVGIPIGWAVGCLMRMSAKWSREEVCDKLEKETQPVGDAIPISFIKEVKQGFDKLIEEWGGCPDYEDLVDECVTRSNALGNLINEWYGREE